MSPLSRRNTPTYLLACQFFMISLTLNPKHTYTAHVSVFSSDGSNYVRSSMLDRLKPKIGCLSLISKRWTCSSQFNVQKNDVRVCSISNLLNLVKALLGSILDCSKPKLGCLSLIKNRRTRSSSFDVPKIMFEFFRCSIKWCSTHH